VSRYLKEAEALVELAQKEEAAVGGDVRSGKVKSAKRVEVEAELGQPVCRRRSIFTVPAPPLKFFRNVRGGRGARSCAPTTPPRAPLEKLQRYGGYGISRPAPERLCRSRIIRAKPRP
jgi:hypothetical protein